MAIFQTPLVFVVLLFVQHSWSAPAACHGLDGGSECGTWDGGCEKSCCLGYDNDGHENYGGECCDDFGLGGYGQSGGNFGESGGCAVCDSECDIGIGGGYGKCYGGYGGYGGHGGIGGGYGDCYGGYGGHGGISGGYGDCCEGYGGYGGIGDGYGGHGGYGGGYRGYGGGGYGGCGRCGNGGYGGGRYGGYDCESSEYCDDSEYCSSNGAGYYGNGQNYFDNNQAASQQAACGQSADYGSGCYGNSNFGGYNNGQRYTKGLNDDYVRSDCLDHNENRFYRDIDSYETWNTCDEECTSSCCSSGVKSYFEECSEDSSCMVADSNECTDVDYCISQDVILENFYNQQDKDCYASGVTESECVEYEECAANVEEACASEEGYYDHCDTCDENSCCSKEEEYHILPYPY